MQVIRRVGLAIVVLMTFLIVGTAPTRIESADSDSAFGPVKRRLASGFGKLPVLFEENVGQVDSRVRYVARRKRASLYLTDESATLSLAGSAITMKVAGGSSTSPRGEAEKETKSNYYIGNDPLAWRTNVRNFGRIVYPNVLDGVDLVYHGEHGQLEYDFIVAPGKDPSKIALEVEGGEGLALTSTGDLKIRTKRGELVQPRPRVYQRDAHGNEHDVVAGYKLGTDGRIAFEVAAYDRARPLVIDPILAFATYLGGSSDDGTVEGDVRHGIATDTQGNVIVAGLTTSDDFPTAAEFQGDLRGFTDAFVTKIKGDGSALVFSTYFGGNSGDEANDVTTDAANNVYITGGTSSFDLPIAGTPFQGKPSSESGDAFVARFGPTGALTYASYLGGTSFDTGYGIKVDATGMYVTGSTYSTNFPMLNAAQATNGGLADVFVTKLNPAGNALVFSTYLGGRGDDLPRAGIAIDPNQNVFVAGLTQSTNFPMVAALDTEAGQGGESFVTKLNASGAFAYSTYLGGDGDDEARGIAADASGNAYVVGYTSSANFPLVAAFQPTKGGRLIDAFLTKFSANGASLVYSTYLGGTGAEFASGVAVDASGNAHVSGYSTSPDFPKKNPLQPQQSAPVGSYDPFVTTFNPAGSALRFSSFVAGGSPTESECHIAFDAAGSLFVSAVTNATDIGVKNALQQGNAGSYDFVLAKVEFPPLALNPASLTIAPRGQHVFTATGGTGSGYVYSLSGGSGGSVTTLAAEPGIPPQARYTAGSTGDTLDVLTVRDSDNNVATANINVGPGVTLKASNPNPAPGDSLTITATGGTGNYAAHTIEPNNSGASLSCEGATCDYTAGNAGGTTDTVTITDDIGNSGSINIAVGETLAVNPAESNVVPRQPLTFTASGGSGGYQFAFEQGGNQSGGTITTDGAYRAGPTPNVTDRVLVTDSGERTATAEVHVGAALAILPATATTPPNGTRTFATTGGATGQLMLWSVTTTTSATIDTTGKYTAGAAGSTTDTVRAEDVYGNVATRVVTVGPAVSITPATTTAFPRGTIDWNATGGSGTGFTFKLLSVGSGEGASIGLTTGVYVAGSTGSSTDIIEVEDSLHNKATRTISVGPGITINPPSPATPPLGSIDLSATGGNNGPYTWAVTSTSPHGSINAAGRYTAGGTGLVVDTIRARDALGNEAFVNVSVGGGLAITPAAPSTPPRGPVAFSATGGSGEGMKWTITDNKSSGSIVLETGSYTAGPTPNVKDVVQVEDSLGNKSTVEVTVGAGVTITPAAATLVPLATQSFGAAGGSGTGFTWAVSTNLTNATISPNGEYTAGYAGGNTDVVTVTDSLGNTASANVTVTASITIDPVNASVPVKGSKLFTASGGSGAYTFEIITNASGGNISATSGAYTAGPKGNVVDIIKVTDVSGAVAVASINVGAVITIAPATPAVSPRGHQTFTATGGTGSGYRWSVIVDASSGATIDPNTGEYVAGTRAHSTDVVQVRDSLGNIAAVSISVGGGLSATPTAPTVPPRGTIAFQGFGGSGTYNFSFFTNASGGEVSPAGVYVAGPTPNVTDVIRLGDQAGNGIAIEIHVGAGVSVNPSAAQVAASSPYSFAVAGGSGEGYVWAFVTNASGGVVGPGGVYLAGATANVTDVISVTDSLGNSATATITVTANSGTTTPIPGVNIPSFNVGGPDDADCGCRTVGSRRASGASLAGAALLVGLAFARRRRR